VKVSSTFRRRRAALIAEITAAFDGVARQDGTTLHEAIAIDDYKSSEEQRAARECDTERRWQDVPDNDIVACESALSFLCEKGFRYYIPAFMICSLKYWEEYLLPLSIPALNSCQFHLTHESQKSLRESEPESIAREYQFTDIQCRAIANFLRFVVDFDPTSADEVTIKAVEKWERFSKVAQTVEN
jgi:hypothetical protein